MRDLRLVRLRSPRGAGSIANRGLSLVDDRFVAYGHGSDLHVRDLRLADDAAPILVIDDCADYAFVSGVLVTCDRAGVFRRFVRDEERFREASRFPGPVAPAHLTLSPSGRSLCFELPPAPGEQRGRVVLVDATTGAVRAVHPFKLSARATFSRVEGGEVLFLSAPVYMDVLLLDAATGSTLRSFVATKSWDFCHTHYALSADGTRLLTFGCVWAAPYEARLYDASPWIRGTEGSGAPLPLVYVQGEDLEGELVLPPRFSPTEDGTFDVVSLVDLRDFRAREVADGAGDASTHAAIVEATRGLSGDHALLQRRVDPGSGAVVGFRVAPTRRVDEVHVHPLAAHQVMLLGDGVQWFDGERIWDVAPFEPPSWFESAVSRDGRIVVCRELVG